MKPLGLVGRRCPMCRGRDWHYGNAFTLPSGVYQRWDCDNCGHGILMPRGDKP